MGVAMVTEEVTLQIIKNNLKPHIIHYSHVTGYGYGGNQWTNYCCNYGHNVSPGCHYNGFWNARNNPYCY